MMNHLKRVFSFVSNKRGLTLIELLAVIVIIGLLSSIAVISVLGLIKDTEEDVCEANSRQLEKDYHRKLLLNGVDHLESRLILLFWSLVRLSLVRNSV